jgi:hypothetical protein
MADPIVCIFPRGEAIRNFAYAGALEMLQEQCGCAILDFVYEMNPQTQDGRHAEAVEQR